MIQPTPNGTTANSRSQQENEMGYRGRGVWTHKSTSWATSERERWGKSTRMRWQLKGKVGDFGARTDQQCSAMEKHRHSPVHGFRTTICKRSREGGSGKTVKTLSVGSSSSPDSLMDATRPGKACFGFTLTGLPSLGWKVGE